MLKKQWVLIKKEDDEHVDCPALVLGESVHAPSGRMIVRVEVQPPDRPGRVAVKEVRYFNEEYLGKI